MESCDICKIEHLTILVIKSDINSFDKKDLVTSRLIIWILQLVHFYSFTLGSLQKGSKRNWTLIIRFGDIESYVIHELIVFFVTNILAYFLMWILIIFMQTNELLILHEIECKLSIN